MNGGQIQPKAGRKAAVDERRKGSSKLQRSGPPERLGLDMRPACLGAATLGRSHTFQRPGCYHKPPFHHPSSLVFGLSLANLIRGDFGVLLEGHFNTIHYRGLI